MKNVIKAVAVSACAAGICLLTACGGCGGSIDYKINTRPNWQIRGSGADDLHENSALLTRSERAVYSVSKTEGGNGNVALEYGEGATYEISLGAKTYAWDDESIPENLRITGNTKYTDYVYVYETSLTLPGKYTVKGESFEFTNTITSICLFRSAANGLTPVYSMQDVVCYTPQSLAPASIDDAYVQLNRVYETWYSRDGAHAEYSIELREGDNGGDVESGNYSAAVGTQYSLFDANQITAALRAMSQSGSYSFEVFMPVNGKNSSYQANWGTATVIDRSDASFAGILGALDGAAESGYIITEPGEDGKRSYALTPVTLNLSAEMAGTSSSYYYCSVTNADMNCERAVLAQINETLPFNLGTAQYKLSSISFE